MQTRSISSVLLAVGMALSACGLSNAQTDVAASLYGDFTENSTGNGTTQSPSNAAGFLLEARHIRNPVIGYEATYAFNRANQTYRSTIPTSCPVGSGICLPTAVSADAHEVTGDWVASLRIANLKPFALAGAGILIDAPAGGQSNTNTNTNTSTSTKAVFVYGAGVDWGLLPHIGLRLQYRGNVYRAPDLTSAFSSTGAFTHTAEPMIGAYFRF
ncbi:MAG: outer membrane beta-barrel protein [Terracidiphilus sp.]